MSEMKFRVQCAGCGATFFSPDRKSRLCPKCVKKRGMKMAPVDTKREEAKPQGARTGTKPGPPIKMNPKPAPAPVKPPKTAELTPELRDRIAQLFKSRQSGSDLKLDEVVAQISDEAWVSRKAVRHVINSVLYPDVVITPEMKERMIEMYKGYVERAERPAGGRRRAIANELGVPLRQVMKIVYDWSISQYTQSPTPELSREQRFEVERVYWDEIAQERHRYTDLPNKIAERLGFTTPYQVSRWLDTLHDDQEKFDKVADVAPEVEKQILEAYSQYLAAAQPPVQGLHSTIANQLDGVSARQVHKVLQLHRYRRRDEYPLK